MLAHRQGAEGQRVGDEGAEAAQVAHVGLHQAAHVALLHLQHHGAPVAPAPAQLRGRRLAQQPTVHLHSIEGFRL